MSINEIFRGKTKEEIIQSICKKIEIPYKTEEADDIFKMSKMIPIHSSDDQYFIYYFMNYYETVEPVNMEAVNPGQHHLPSIEVKVESKVINIDQKIFNWQKIYLYLLKIIKDNSKTVEELNLNIKRDVISNTKYIENIDELMKLIYMCNHIYQLEFRFQCNFILMNSELSDYFPSKINNFNIIFDDNVEGITVGRKNEKLDYGLFLAKYKDKFKIFEPENLDKAFMTIKYNLIDDNQWN